MTDPSLLRSGAGQSRHRTGYGSAGTETGFAEVVRQQPEAMDSDTYREILARLPQLRAPGCLGKAPQGGLDAGSGLMTTGAETVYEEHELKLQRDIALKKASWHGDFWKDAWYWTCNFNPVLAFFYSHRLHPVSQVERGVAMFLHVVFVMVVSCLVPRASLRTAAWWDLCTDDPKVEAWRICCLSQLGGLLFAVVVSTIFTTWMIQLGSTRGWWGHLITIAVFLVAVFFTGLWLLLNWERDMLGSALVNFARIEPLSIVGTSAAQTLIFTLAWCRQQQENANDEGYEHYFVTSSDYAAFVSAGARIDLSRLR